MTAIHQLALRNEDWEPLACPRVLFLRHDLIYPGLASNSQAAQLLIFPLPSLECWDYGCAAPPGLLLFLLSIWFSYLDPPPDILKHRLWVMYDFRGFWNIILHLISTLLHSVLQSIQSGRHCISKLSHKDISLSRHFTLLLSKRNPFRAKSKSREQK